MGKNWIILFKHELLFDSPESFEIATDYKVTQHVNHIQWVAK